MVTERTFRTVEANWAARATARKCRSLADPILANVQFPFLAPMALVGCVQAAWQKFDFARETFLFERSCDLGICYAQRADCPSCSRIGNFLKSSTPTNVRNLPFGALSVGALTETGRVPTFMTSMDATCVLISPFAYAKNAGEIFTYDVSVLADNCPDPDCE